MSGGDGERDTDDADGFVFGTASEGAEGGESQTPASDRRSYLKALGAAGVGVLGGGAVVAALLHNGPAANRRSQPSNDGSAPRAGNRSGNRSGGGRAIPLGRRYDRVVNVVRAGADPTGGKRIDDVVAEHARDGTALVFPDGTYRTGALSIETDDFAMVAASGASPVVVPSGPASDVGSPLIEIEGANPTFRGIDFDFRRAADGGRLQVISERGDLHVSDVRASGTYPKDTAGFRFDVRDPDGRGLVENVVARGGQVDDTDGFGMFVGREHAGVLTVRNCEIEGFPNNGLYASDPGYPDGGRMGEVHVEGGLYKNNNIANVRLGTPGSYARGVTVVVDERPPRYPGGQNARGIRLDETGGLRVENCDIVVEAAGGDGALVAEDAAGRSLVADTHIRVDVDGLYAINAKEPKPGVEGRMRFENVAVTGTASGGSAVSVIRRDGTAFVGCCLDQSGPRRDGLYFGDAEDCRVLDSTLAVTGRPLTADAPVETRAIRYRGNCPAPSPTR